MEMGMGGSAGAASSAENEAKALPLHQLFGPILVSGECE